MEIYRGNHGKIIERVGIRRNSGDLTNTNGGFFRGISLGILVLPSGAWEIGKSPIPDPKSSVEFARKVVKLHGGI